MFYFVTGIILCIGGLAQMVLSFFEPFRQYNKIMNISTAASTVALGMMLISEGVQH